jgi:hypothetical protein
MRARGAMVQGALAAVGLLGAWATWQREPDRAPGEALVLDVTHNDLAKIRFEDDKKWLELEPHTGDGVWLHVSARADAKTPERVLRGNESAEKLLDKFAPLRASRALGALGADKLKEFGLDAPKKKIVITARGATSTLQVGTSPFGVSDPYVKDERDGKVYMLGGGVLSDLESAATRLVDRSLHTFLPSEFDGLALSAGGKKRELVQTNPESAAAAKLAPKANPGKPDDLAKNWHDKVWRMVGVDVLGHDEAPASGTPEIVARLDYTMRGKERGFAELGRVAGKPAVPPATTPPQNELYVRTEHSAGWIKLSPTSEDLFKEAEKVAATAD